MADTKIVECKCPKCARELKKVTKRPNQYYTWKCDVCNFSYGVEPGFEFYSCK